MNGQDISGRQRLLVAGSFRGKPASTVIQALNGGDPVPLNPDIFLGARSVRQMGRDRWLGPDRNCHLSVASGQQRVRTFRFRPHRCSGARMVKRLYVRQVDAGPIIRVSRCDLSTSQCKILKELMPPDRVGVSTMFE